MNHIDERVVEMTFENRQFENGVAQTMETLDKLKKSLIFKDSTVSLKELNKEVDNTDLSKIADSVTALQKRFSVMGEVVHSTLTGIINKAKATGESLVKSLSVNQIMAGWNKYDQETTSVQTIMVSLGETADIQKVEEELAKLAWYSDETSYSYTDMTSSLAKFISSGQGLEDSVQAIQGLATAAAGGGVSVSKATQAFYNFSQAMGTGYMGLADWKSIELLNMATPKFKQEILDAAEAMGKVRKNADGTYTSLVNATDDFTLETFRNSLTTGKWMDNSVMMKVLSNYASYANKVYNTQLEKGFDTAREAMEYLDNTSEAFNQVYKSSFEAAQTAKTFSEAIDSIKDAVSTGWKTTFATIFGNYEEAKVLWSDFADFLYEIFAEGAWTRNQILADWKEQGGRDNLIEGLEQAFENILQILRTVRAAIKEIFPEIEADKLVDVTNGFAELMKAMAPTENELETLRNIIKAILIPIKAVFGILKSLWPIAKTILAFAYQLIEVILSSVGDILTSINQFVNKIMSLNSAKDTLEKIDGFFEHLQKTISQLSNLDFGIPTVEDAVKWFDKLIGKLKSVAKSTTNYAGSIKALNKVTSGGAGGGNNAKYAMAQVNTLKQITDAINSSDPKTGAQNISTWEKIVNRLSLIIQSLSNNKAVMATAVLGIGLLIRKLLMLNKLPLAGNSILAGAGVIAIVLASWGQLSKDCANANGAIPKIKNAWIKIKEFITEAYNWIVGPYKSIFNNPNFKQFVDTWTEILKGLYENVGSTINKIGARLAEKLRNFNEMWKGISTDNIVDGINEFNKIVDALRLREGIGILFAFAFRKFVLGLASFLSGMGEGIESIFNFAKSINGFIDSASGAMKNLGKYLKRSSFKEVGLGVLAFADAILVIVGAVLAIYYLVDQNDKKIWASAAIVGIIMAALTFMAITVSKGAGTNASAVWNRQDGLKITGWISGKGGLISVGLSLIAMVGALKMLDTVNKDNLNRNFGIIIAMMAGLMIVSMTMSDFSKNRKPFTSGSLLPLNIAIAIIGLVNAIKIIDNMTLKDPGKTIGILVVSILALSVLMRALGTVKFGAGAGVLTFSVGVVILIYAIRRIGALSDTVLANKTPVLIALGAALVICSALAMWYRQAYLILPRGSHLVRLSANITAFAGAVVLLGIAFRIIAGVRVNTWIKAVAVLAGMSVAIGGLIGAVAVIRRCNRQISNFGGTLSGFAFMIASIAGSMYLISMIPKEKLWSSFGVVTILTTVIMGMVALWGKCNVKFPGARAAAPITAFVGVIATLMIALAVLSFFPQKELFQTAVSIGIILIALGATMYGFGKVSSNTAKLFPRLLGIATFLAIVGGIFWALLDLCKMDPEAIKTTAVAFKKVLRALASSMSIITKAGVFEVNGKAMIKTISMMGLLFFEVALIYAGLAKHMPRDPEGMTEAITNISHIIIALSLSMAMLAGASRMQNAKAGKMVGMVGMMGLLFLELGALYAGLAQHMNRNTEGMAEAIKSIALIVGALSVSMVIIAAASRIVAAGQKNTIATTLGLIVGMGLIFAEFGFLFATMMNYGFADAGQVERMAGVATAIGHVVLMLSLAMVPLALAGKIGGAEGVAIGVIGLAVLFGLLGTILLVELANLHRKLSKWTDLSDIATRLSEFATNLEGFIAVCSKIDGSFAAGVVWLVDALVKIAQEFKNKTWNRLEKFCDENNIKTLQDFADPLIGLVDKFNQLNENGLAKARSVIQLLNDLNDVTTVSFSGDLFSKDAKEKLDQFTTDITDFVQSIGNITREQIGWAEQFSYLLDVISGFKMDDMSENVLMKRSFDTETLSRNLTGMVDSVMEFIQSLVENDISATDEILAGRFASICERMSNFDVLSFTQNSYSNVTNFADSLSALAPAITEFISNISELKNTDVSKAELFRDVVSPLCDAQKLIPTKAADMSDWSEDIKQFGNGMKTFFNSLSYLDTGNSDEPIALVVGNMVKELPSTLNMDDIRTKVEFLCEIVSIMSNATALIPSEGSLATLFTGVQDIGEFGQRLATFGQAMNTYSASIIGIDSGIVEKTELLLSTLALLNEPISNMDPNKGFIPWLKGQKDIGDIGAQLEELGAGLENYMKSIDLLGLDNINSAIGLTQEIIELVSGVGDSTRTSSLTALTEFSNYGLEEFVTALGSEYTKTKVQEGIDKFVERIYDALNNDVTRNRVKTAYTDCIDTVFLAISELAPRMERAGLALMDLCIAGMRKSISDTDIGTLLGIAVKYGFVTETKIDSPSRVFYQYGGYITQGLANGIRDTTYRVTDRTETLTDRMLDSFLTPMQIIGDILDGNLEYDPVIRPVVDLENVERAIPVLNSFSSYERAVRIASGGVLRGNRSDNIDTVSELNRVRKGMEELKQAYYDSNDGGERIAAAVRDGLKGTEITMSGKKVGTVVTKAQNSTARASGTKLRTAVMK